MRVMIAGALKPGKKWENRATITRIYSDESWMSCLNREAKVGLDFR